MIYSDRHQASSSHYMPMIPLYVYASKPKIAFALIFKEPSSRWLDDYKAGRLRTVITYASPVFAHTAPTTLKKLQVLYNKCCRSTTNANLCVKNSVLHRDLDLPSITKYMKDATERFFLIAKFHLNPFLTAAASYEAPPPCHFIRRPRNIITDPPDVFSAEVERLLSRLDIKMDSNGVDVPVTSCAKRTTLIDPPQCKTRAVSTPVCCPAALVKAE
ncbi:hypothetical protein EVAR_4631_1 [Eumeta japonica]|uniref:Uncharacterized protein n=1 Tax=Eumeta variegata TaxID=151549 RepID=A0A4C1SZS2_EUMVA|nr:hypothetical protein EVAR_4631_1 [Eumeta japonica]